MSPYPDATTLDAPRGTGRVGADLRAARERIGWTLPAVAAHLRIRLPYLEAIEDGRIDELPGNAYAMGFLRTYAGALGLDPDEISRRFRAEAADVNRKTELSFPAPVPERGVPAGAVVLVGVILAIGAYVGWYRMSGSDRPASAVVQPVPERLAPLAATAAPVPRATPAAGPSPVSQPTSEAAAMVAAASPGGPLPPPPSATPAPPPVPTPVRTAPPPPAPDVFGPPGPGQSFASLTSVNPPPAPTVGAPAPNVPPPPPVGPAAANLPPQPPGTRIVIRAKAESWVQVRDKQAGKVLLNRNLRPGEIWPVPVADKSALQMTTGNAAGIELIVDGVVTPPLGADGAVRRDMTLDPEAIREGKLAAPGSSAPGPASANTTAGAQAQKSPVSR